MKRETEMVFAHVMREDRSVLEFLDSDYTFVNEDLAKHYGIPGVPGQGVPPRDAAREQPARRHADAGRRC